MGKKAQVQEQKSEEEKVVEVDQGLNPHIHCIGSSDRTMCGLPTTGHSKGIGSGFVRASDGAFANSGMYFKTTFRQRGTAGLCLVCLHTLGLG